MQARAFVAKALPYWLSSIDELCSACEQPYAHGTGLHCAACDSGLCALCVTFLSGEAFCVACTPKKRTARKRAKGRTWQRARSGKG